jgi:hypothetical protein
MHCRGRPLRWVERALFASAGIACFLPSMWLSVAGFVVLAVLACMTRLGSTAAGAASQATRER